MSNKKTILKMTKDEFREKKEAEEEIMKRMFEKPPVDVLLGGKKALISHIAATAVELYELNTDLSTEEI